MKKNRIDQKNLSRQKTWGLRLHLWNWVWSTVLWSITGSIWVWSRLATCWYPILGRCTTRFQRRGRSWSRTRWNWFSIGNLLEKLRFVSKFKKNINVTDPLTWNTVKHNARCFCQIVQFLGFDCMIFICQLFLCKKKCKNFHQNLWYIHQKRIFVSFLNIWDRLFRST